MFSSSKQKPGYHFWHLSFNFSHSRSYFVFYFQHIPPLFPLHLFCVIIQNVSSFFPLITTTGLSTSVLISLFVSLSEPLKWIFKYDNSSSAYKPLKWLSMGMEIKAEPLSGMLWVASLVPLPLPRSWCPTVNLSP